MRPFIDSVRELNILKASKVARAIGTAVTLSLTAQFAALGQVPASPQSPPPPAVSPAVSAATQTAIPPAEPTGLASDLKKSPHAADGSIEEEQFKQLLGGKTFFLRDAYLDNSLDFDQQGKLEGSSPRGSYTLSAIRINKVKFSKHKVQLEGDRYALHFLGELPHQDPLKDVDRVKITPKKKIVKISIDREQVEKPKKEKHKVKNKQAESFSVAQVASASPAPPSPARRDAAVSEPSISDTPAQSKQLSSTATPVHASQTLVNALDRVFAPQIDDRMIAGMPDFWKLYYKAAAANADYIPSDPGVFRQGDVDQKARLLSTVDPPSNDLAQSNGVAGMALYHAIIGSDGQVAEVVAGRPIGFGLDEGAVEAIRKAKFQPAIKGGRSVPVTLDLVVAFRIYSNRTSQPAVQAADSPNQPVLPGPYSVQPQ
jgi:TonB family protein